MSMSCPKLISVSRLWRPKSVWRPEHDVRNTKLLVAADGARLSLSPARFPVGTGMVSNIWFEGGVAAAVATCRAENTAMVVFIAPKSAILHPLAGSRETSAGLLARVATTSMHRNTFALNHVVEAVRGCAAVCIQLAADADDTDFAAFSAYVHVSSPQPNLFIVGPTGTIFVAKRGYVSPRAFLISLQHATDVLSGGTPHPAVVAAASRHAERISTSPHRVMRPAPSPERATQVAVAAREANIGSSDQNTVPPVVQKQSPTTLTAGKSAMVLPGAVAKSMPKAAAGCRLRARLPDGRQAQRTFVSTTPFSAVRTWLSEECACRPDTIVVGVPFPRRTLDSGEDPKMLSELGLSPSATLVVATVGPAHANPQGSTGVIQSASTCVASYASSAFGIIGGFVRSFAGSAGAEGEGEGTDQPRQQPQQESLQQQPQRPQARDGEDDNLFWNGNGTQFGAPPRGDDEPGSNAGQ